MRSIVRLLRDLVALCALFLLAVFVVPAIPLTMKQSDQLVAWSDRLGIDDPECLYAAGMGVIYFAVAFIVFIAAKWFAKKFM